MSSTVETTTPLDNCSLEPDGTVTCKICKSRFENIQKLGIKPRRVIFEIQDVEE